MEINRNQWFMAGLVVLLLGAQFRSVETVELTPQFTQFLAERTGHPLASVGATTQAILPSQPPIIKKVLRPPDFIGWGLLSLGAVLVLHSLGMAKPS